MNLLLTIACMTACVYAIKLLFVSEQMISELKKESEGEQL
jgi:hypothetical protein